MKPLGLRRARLAGVPSSRTDAPVWSTLPGAVGRPPRPDFTRKLLELLDGPAGAKPLFPTLTLINDLPTIVIVIAK
jgi:hypothetical protein